MKKSKKKMGRPKLFNTVEELQKLMLTYLENCKTNKPPLMPNRAGLCTEIGISRDSYYEYRKKQEDKSKPDFSDSIKRFEQATENTWVQRLGGNSPTGAIFYLKNAFKEDYKDKHEIENNGKLTLAFDPIFNETTNPPQ